ncbi:putative ribonuclease H-like domain-containing protein [Tanacetum coccineum]
MHFLMNHSNDHLICDKGDAKTLFAAIQTRFGGNEATKKTQKTLLKKMYKNFSATSTESLESIFIRLQEDSGYDKSKKLLQSIVDIDGAGFDWSYMADDEVPTNMALMAFSDSEEFQQPEFEGYGPKTSKSVSEDISNEVRESPDAPLVKELVSDDKLEKKTVFQTLPKAVNTARPNSAVVNVVRANQGHPQKEDQGYVDSGCSRHMTGNMSYLSDFKEFNGGYVTFRGGAKGGKITGKETLKIVVACTNSNDFVDGSLFDSSSKNASNDEPQPFSDAGKKDDEGVCKESGIADQEKPENSTQGVNTAGPSINTEPDMFSLGDNATLEATHADFFGDETEVDMSNITTTYPVPSTPNTRIHKDHSLDHVIGDVQSGVLKRRMTKTTNKQGFISVVYEGKTHKDLYTCLFACFLSQIEPKKKVWTLVDLPYGNRAIGTKLVYRNKKDERVVRIEAIRLFLAYASFMNFVVYQMDVKSAFLYGKIEEEVYVCQPLGFGDPEFPNRVYKVEKALYGLHQAPRVWYETLSTYLLENEFQRGTIDKTLFIKKVKGKRKVSHDDKREKGEEIQYTVTGFVYAFMIWILEAIRATHVYVSKEPTQKISRALAWKTILSFNWSRCRTLFVGNHVQSEAVSEQLEIEKDGLIDDDSLLSGGHCLYSLIPFRVYMVHIGTLECSIDGVRGKPVNLLLGYSLPAAANKARVPLEQGQLDGLVRISQKSQEYSQNQANTDTRFRRVQKEAKEAKPQPKP